MRLSRRFVLAVIAAVLSLPVFGKVSARADQPMRIGVIGSGALGLTVGGLWVQAGHEVMFASRNPDELAQMVKRLGGGASVGSPREAAEFGDAVLFAVPYAALPRLGRELHGALAGKVVLDATNPSGHDDDLSREAMTEGVGPTSAKYLPGVLLVRAFSAVDAISVATSARRSDGKLGVPVAGDDDGAVDLAAQLVRDAGCEPVVVGDLASAKIFQRGAPGFRANTNAPFLRDLLDLPEAR